MKLDDEFDTFVNEVHAAVIVLVGVVFIAAIVAVFLFLLAYVT